MFRRTLNIKTPGRGFQEITGQIQALLSQAGVQTGLCSLFLQHTSASLILSENADPSVGRDLEAFFSRLIPDGDPLFEHRYEGPDDMPAHLRSVLTQNELTLPVERGRLDLGTWQGIYLWEHRYQSHRRRLKISIW